MTTTPERDVDRSLRDALEPTPEQVRRVTLAALAEEEQPLAPSGRRRVRWALAALAAALLLIVGGRLLVDFTRPSRAPATQAGPSSSGGSAGPILASAPSSPPGVGEAILITNRQGVVTVESPAGTSLIFLPGDL